MKLYPADENNLMIDLKGKKEKPMWNLQLAEKNNLRFDKEESVLLNWESDAGLTPGRFGLN